MSRISERLLAQQQITLDTAPLRAALRKLRQALEHPKAKLYLESLAKRPTIAVATLARGDDGTTIMLKPSRELAMFLQRVKPRHPDLPNHD